MAGGNVTEPSSSNGYARVALTTSYFGSAASSGSISNTVSAIWNEVVNADWGTVGAPLAYVTIHDAPTGGNLLMWKALSISKVVAVGTSATMKAGEIAFDFNNNT